MAIRTKDHPMWDGHDGKSRLSLDKWGVSVTDNDQIVICLIRAPHGQDSPEYRAEFVCFRDDVMDLAAAMVRGVAFADADERAEIMLRTEQV